MKKEDFVKTKNGIGRIEETYTDPGGNVVRIRVFEINTLDILYFAPSATNKPYGVDRSLSELSKIEASEEIIKEWQKAKREYNLRPVISPRCPCSRGVPDYWRI